MGTCPDAIAAALDARSPVVKALSELEGPIYRALKFAKLAKLLADVRGDDGTPEFKEECAEGMVFLADEVFAQIDKVDDVWLALWNSDVSDRTSEAS